MAPNLNRVSWVVTGRIMEAVADLFQMMVNILKLQDDLRRWKKQQPETGVIENRPPEELIGKAKEELDEYAAAIVAKDLVNEYEEAADLLLRLFRIFATRGLSIRKIIRIFFAKMRAIAESDLAQQKRDKAVERAVMERIVAEHEGE